MTYINYYIERQTIVLHICFVLITTMNQYKFFSDIVIIVRLGWFWTLLSFARYHQLFLFQYMLSKFIFKGKWIFLSYVTTSTILAIAHDWRRLISFLRNDLQQSIPQFTERRLTIISETLYSFLKRFWVLKASGKNGKRIDERLPVQLRQHM